MNDEERAKTVRKLQEDIDNYISNLEPKKYEDGWPEDKWEEEMEKHPFFMSKPLEGQDLPPLVEAIQQLKYDSEFNTPEELAKAYKVDGNKKFEEKEYIWAVEVYSKGIDAKCEDNELNAVLYSNRATAQYYAGNYRKALEDATEAKSLNPEYIKAIYRGAMCLLELKEYDNCISWCIDGLKVNKGEAENTTLTDLKRKAQEQKEIDEQLKKKAVLMEQELQLLNEAIRERGICVEGTCLTAQSLEPIYPQAAGFKVHLTPKNVLVWPVYFFYPEFTTLDFIETFSEKDCFFDQLTRMFDVSPDWDEKKEYTAESVQVYFTDCNNALVPVDKMLDLKSVMRYERYILKSGTPSFVVMVSNSEFEKTYRAKN